MDRVNEEALVFRFLKDMKHLVDEEIYEHIRTLVSDIVKRHNATKRMIALLALKVGLSKVEIEHLINEAENFAESHVINLKFNEIISELEKKNGKNVAAK
ncbi:MAG: hypothetical protein JW938_00930 [Candidatus Omnitrophica bacterium]|nr:hypothetical protein [Candidatus Omnitrophota bacterium]